MRFRIGLLLGLAVGYLLGAKAGRERYEQIMKRVERLRTSESVQRIGTTTEKVTRSPRAATGDGMIRAANAIRVKVAPVDATDQPDSR